jgi:hypothetical protein
LNPEAIKPSHDESKEQPAGPSSLLTLGGTAEEVAGKVDFAASAPKGPSDFEGLTVSLKRYPDTKPEFFRKP